MNFSGVVELLTSVPSSFHLSLLCVRFAWKKNHGNNKFNTLTSVFYASVLLLIMNFVTTFAKAAMDVMTKFVVNNKTDA